MHAINENEFFSIQSKSEIIGALGSRRIIIKIIYMKCLINNVIAKLTFVHVFELNCQVTEKSLRKIPNGLKSLGD